MKYSKRAKERARERTERRAKNREQFGSAGTNILDLGGKRANYFKPGVGRNKNLIDILPFIYTEDWCKKLRTPSGDLVDLQPGDIDYKMELPMHRSIGEDNVPLVCPRLAFGKKCAVCEDLYAEWEKPEDDQDEKKIAALKPKWRDWYNIYDYNDEEKGFQIWGNVSFFNFEQQLLEAMDTDERDIGCFYDLDEGFSIEFKGREKNFGKITYVEAHSFDFVKRDPYKEETLKKVFGFDKLVKILTYEEIAKIHLGIEGDEDNDNVGQDDKEDDIPDTAEGCPHGLKWGIDAGFKSECNSCTDKYFTPCSEAQDRMSKDESNKPVEDKKETKTINSPKRRKRKI